MPGRLLSPFYCLSYFCPSVSLVISVCLCVNLSPVCSPLTCLGQKETTGEAKHSGSLIFLFWFLLSTFRGIQGIPKSQLSGWLKTCTGNRGSPLSPFVAQSLGDWHRVALERFQKLASALARHTGQDEGQMVDHLVKRVSIILQKGLAFMLLNCVPGQPPWWSMDNCRQYNNT